MSNRSFQQQQSSNNTTDYGSVNGEKVGATTQHANDALDGLLNRRPPLVDKRAKSHSTLIRAERHKMVTTQQQHHRRRTSISQVLHVTEQDIREIFQQELQRSDSGRSFFMDMNMTRSMSILPEDLDTFVEETTHLDQRIYDDSNTEDEECGLLPSAAVPESPASQLSAYLMLLLAVVAVSSNGTALHMLHTAPAPLKLYWRMTATAMLLSAFLMKNALCNKQFKSSAEDPTSMIMQSEQWLILGMAVIAFCVHTLLMYTALEYTTIGNAVIYGNSQALLLIVGKAFVGEDVTWTEGVGVATAFSGAILCSLDSEASSNDDDNDEKHAVFGDLLALLSAVAGVAYLTFAKAVRPFLSVTFFMFLIMFLGSWLVLLYMLVTGVPLTLSRDIHTGLFGWVTMEESHLLIMVHIAIVCNFVGTMGFVRAMQVFDTIIIAVSTLLEPLIASLIAVAFHVGLMPGPLGFLGNALVTAGTIAVVSSAAKK